MATTADIEEISQLSADVARSLSAKHMVCLPCSSLTQLGEGATTAFYQFTARSKAEKLFVFRDNTKEIAAVCVLSFSPETIKRRLIFDIPTAASFVVASVRKQLGFLSSRTQKSSRISGGGVITDYQLPPPDPSDKAPEVLHIFADIACRGTGVGRCLMETAEQAVSENGHPRIVVQTQADRENSALKFYSSIGYTPCYISKSGSKSLVQLEKNMAESNSAKH